MLKSIYEKFKNCIFSISNWVYIKLIPYPRIRYFLGNINARLKLFKDIYRLKNMKAYNSHSNTVMESKDNPLNILVNRVNAAFIVDEFTFNSFKYECNAFPLNPHNWRKVFEENDIQLLFCESAWTGIDPIIRPWRGKIYCSERFPRENRTELFQIIRYCKKKKIPTVFWNKEDPVFYGDNIHNFVDTALHFDHIFTTDIDCLEKYKEDFGHPSVHLMMFATQPRLFNPIERFVRTNEVVFAGSWYNQYPKRCEEMEFIFDKLINESFPLKIYDRQSSNKDPNHEFPDKYKKYILPVLPHDQIEKAYKSSHIALNINTITKSETMFARRVFELMSSNTLVLSNYSVGIEKMFGENVVFVRDDYPIDITGSDKKREYCLEQVLKYHTYEKRFAEVLNVTGIENNKQTQDVVLIYEVEDLHTSEKCVEHFYSMDWENKRAILLVSENYDVDEFQKIMVNYHNQNISVYSKRYCKDHIECLKLHNKYYIWVDISLKFNFFQKAFLHTSYLEDNIGIVESDEKYKIFSQTISRNTLFPCTLFEQFKQKIFNNVESKNLIYGI